ncbi:quinone oxidoreductase-like protein 1 isoform X2 [Myotis myotis]|uniref:quinone oxidoreductase-like protein 1 isoform X2 n=1 Tax=Myotis myotis TaxID=51298 RepID=UPI00174C1D2F|nr:quinone oxidoreductase-like protein 1 isoform X2 [Myotis myotis]
MGVGPGPAGAGSLQKDSKVAAAKGQAVTASRKQVTMKGLYFQRSSTNEKITFVFQERETLPVAEDNYVKLQVKACALSRINTKLLAEMKMEKDFFPVGREIAGIVLDVGSKVSFFQPDDEVVGILPLDSEDPGLCEAVRVHEHYLVHKPEKVSWTEAAGTVGDGVRAYTALHYLSRLSPGKWVLIMDGASALGTIAIQLAHHRGAKVISTACSPEDRQYLEGLRPALARVIDVSGGKAHVAESCLEETGGLGVDIVLDAGVRLYSEDDEPAAELQLLPHKHDILTLLGVGGHWVTTEENLQASSGRTHPAVRGQSLHGRCSEKARKKKASCSVLILSPRSQLNEPIPVFEARVSLEIVQKSQGR